MDAFPRLSLCLSPYSGDFSDGSFGPEQQDFRGVNQNNSQLKSKLQAPSQAGPEVQRCIKIGEIISTVCAYLNIAPADVKLVRRETRVTLARELIILFAREMTELSFPEIARVLLRPNHSTIGTAYKRILTKIAENTELTDNERDGRLTEQHIVPLVEALRARIIEVSKGPKTA